MGVSFSGFMSNVPITGRPHPAFEHIARHGSGILKNTLIFKDVLDDLIVSSFPVVSNLERAKTIGIGLVEGKILTGNQPDGKNMGVSFIFSRENQSIDIGNYGHLLGGFKKS